MCYDAISEYLVHGLPPPDDKTSEQVMVDMMKADLGVDISPQAWRLFLRWRWDRFAPLAHRVHDGKR